VDLVDALIEGRPVLVDCVDGGWMSWGSPEYNDMHPVDPLLFELGWRVWEYLVEEGVGGGPDLTALPPDYEPPWTFEPG
jgi:hypothetical protein